MLADAAHTQQAPIEDLARRFSWFAEHSFQGSSPLYERLARRIADDPEILKISAAADPHQPVPLLLFGAIQYLLIGQTPQIEPLLLYYPSLTGNGTRPAVDPYPLFREFCLTHQAEIEQIISTRRVQTNEVRRCTGLMLAFNRVVRQENQPLALVELGASAGLNLLWDRYSYDYGSAGRVGDADAPLVLSAELRGEQERIVPMDLPPAVSSIGIDLHPVDARNSEQARWLRALIWPEQTDRAARLERALEVARGAPPLLVEGDVLEVLPATLATISNSAALVVYHSYMLNQFPAQARDQLEALLAARSFDRTIHRIAIEWIDGGKFPTIRHTLYQRGSQTEALLAHVDPHGAWVEWLANETEETH